MDRREFLAGSMLATLVAITARAGETRAPAPSAQASDRRSAFYVTAETTAGRARGISIGGIRRFQGVPYGALTGGRNRFMPPQPVAPWSGVRNATGYGPIAPQPFSDPAHPFGLLIDWDLQPGPMSEDCLNLNLWTPGLDGAKRPVLVYFHGAGRRTTTASSATG